MLSRAKHATRHRAGRRLHGRRGGRAGAEAGGAAAVRDRAAFEALREVVGRELDQRTLDVVERVEQVLAAAYDVQARLRGTTSMTAAAGHDRPAGPAGRAGAPGLRHATAGAARLPDLLRYLQGHGRAARPAARRPGARPRLAVPGRDGRRPSSSTRWRALPPGREPSPALREVRWMVEELRVSLFAPTMRTAYPVSPQRIHRAIVAA